MNWIQVLLIVSIIALLVYLLRSRRSAQSKAWVKVGYVLVRASRRSTRSCGPTTPPWWRIGLAWTAAPT